MKMNFNDLNKIYFIGTGGIGMSALARYFLLHGMEVHGYDRTETPLTRALADEGMHVHYTDDVSYIPEGVDLVVYTPAVPKEHGELNWFLERGYPVKKRAEVLGIISKARRCVALAGTHGKTTTSTMTAWLMRSCGIDASAFLGGISGNLGSNFVEGKSEWVVVEADEYDRSFLQLYPEIAVINSIDADHLDIYGSEEGVRESYRAFSGQVKEGGVLLLENHVDMDVPGALRFGTGTGDFRAVNIRADDGFMVFDLQTDYPGLPGELSGLKLPYPGLHNVRNAVAAIASTLLAGGHPEKIAEALAGFRGAKRRFEVIARTAKTVYVDDYAHHPAELEATIDAARLMYPGKKITGVFQPHLFSRTRDFADAFAAALDKLDNCLLLPIYPAREQPIDGVTSEMLLAKMTLGNRVLVQKSELLEMIGNNHPELLITMGAGDIDTLVEPLKNLIENH